MADGQVYDIPEKGLQWLKDRVAKLSRRIEKLGGEPIYLTVVGFHFEKVEDSSFKEKIWEVFLAVPEIKIAGWEFLAKIDHLPDTGNILRKLCSEELPEKYRNTDPHCDHCRTNRRRNETFVLRNMETLEFKQVGSTCLKDFTGHEDADKLAKLAALSVNLSELVNMSRRVFSAADRHWIDNQEFLGHVAQSILEHGWRSIRESRDTGQLATRSDTLNRYQGVTSAMPSPISDTARSLADAAREWAMNLGSDGKDIMDYEHNIKVVASMECFDEKATGLAASIVGAYRRRFSEAKPASTFQGEVNEKIERQVKVVMCRRKDNYYICRFQDSSGNIYTAFSNSNPNLLIGDEIVIQGRVKRHDQFKGEKQTLLNYIKITGDKKSK